MGISGNETCDMTELRLQACAAQVGPWSWCFPANGIEAPIELEPAPEQAKAKPGVCLCSYMQGFEGPTCESRTTATDTQMAMLVVLLTVSIAMIGKGLRVRRAWVREKRVKAQYNSMDMSLDALLVTKALMAFLIFCSVLENVQLSPIFGPIRTAAIFVCGSSMIVSWMLVALGWIEICAASEQLMSAALNRSPLIAKCGAVLFSMISVPIYLIGGSPAHASLMLLSLFVLNVLFFIGGRRISKLLLTSSLVSSANSDKRVQPASSSGSQGRKLDGRFARQLKRIMRASMFLHAGSLLFFACGVLSEVISRRRYTHRELAIRPYTVWLNVGLFALMLCNYGGLTFFVKPKKQKRVSRTESASSSSTSQTSVLDERSCVLGATSSTADSPHSGTMTSSSFAPSSSTQEDEVSETHRVGDSNCSDG